MFLKVHRITFLIFSSALLVGLYKSHKQYISPVTMNRIEHRVLSGHELANLAPA